MGVKDVFKSINTDAIKENISKISEKASNVKNSAAVKAAA